MTLRRTLSASMVLFAAILPLEPIAIDRLGEVDRRGVVRRGRASEADHVSGHDTPTRWTLSRGEKSSDPLGTERAIREVFMSGWVSKWPAAGRLRRELP